VIGIALFDICEVRTFVAKATLVQDEALTDWNDASSLQKEWKETCAGRAIVANYCTATFDKLWILNEGQLACLLACSYASRFLLRTGWNDLQRACQAAVAWRTFEPRGITKPNRVTQCIGEPR
jgi:hypothetical protein